MPNSSRFLNLVLALNAGQVFAINAMAPAIINARLKPLMERDRHAMKFIVNVSAMEGKFYRFKNETHPHTNMAKASLNMMTRTSAQDYVKSKIYMTAVDTGWINDEKPLPQAQQHFQVRRARVYPAALKYQRPSRFLSHSHLNLLHPSIPFGTAAVTLPPSGAAHRSTTSRRRSTSKTLRRAFSTRSLHH